ncbi:MAG: hypothetical protein U1E27_06795 [Kiritimatiellia bacterium]|nr:hypothetical protein [Kiritimatiellia bacterium]
MNDLSSLKSGTCDGRCSCCSEAENQSSSDSLAPQGARLAAWSALVFLLPLFTAAGSAYVARFRGAGVGAAAGVGGFLAGALLARAVYALLRPGRPLKSRSA